MPAYVQVDELQVLRELVRTILPSQSNAEWFPFRGAYHRQLARASSEERDLMSVSGKLHFGLAVAVLFRQHLPSVISQPVLEVVIADALDILTSKETDAKLYQLIGVISQSIHGHDSVHRFLSKSLGIGLMARLANATLHFPESVGVDILPEDRLHKLLLRLKQFTDEQIDRPAKLSELSPPIVPIGVAPSKTPHYAPTPYAQMLMDAKGDLPGFLQRVADAELLSDGWFPCCLPAMESSPWASLIESLRRRRVALSIGGAVLNAFVSDLLMEKNAVVKLSVHNAILAVSTSARTLLLVLFRMGVYQLIPECPFDGLDADYPATALRLFFAALHGASQGNHSRVKGAIINLLSNVVDVLINAYQYFSDNAPSRKFDAAIPAGQGSPKRRKVLAERSDAESNLPAKHSERSLDTPLARQRRTGRTTVPNIVSARSRHPPSSEKENENTDNHPPPAKPANPSL
ncbi:hypothetical protein B0H11DRAFT_1975868 [Mycena galericulata]|nr:hypothetical protein B0H11DRAFT_1975868 [Mycena galericulata]